MTYFTPHSKPVHIFDSPDIASVNAEFIYNFFTANERIDESGFKQLIDKDQMFFSSNGVANYKNINARVPRLIQLTINYSDDSRRMMDESFSRGELFDVSQQDLERAISEGNVVTEQSATARFYNGYTSGNSGLNEELNNVMRLKLNTFFQARKEEGLTPDQALTMLSERTSVSVETLTRLLPPKLNDVLGLNGEDHQDISELEPGLASSSAKIQLSSMFAPMIQRRSVERGTSLLDSAAANRFLLSADIVKSDPIMSKNLGVAPPRTAGELVFSLPFFREPRVLSDSPRGVSDSGAAAAVVGLLVEKFRVYKGRRYKMPSIVIAGRSPTTILDSKVAYGQVYEYKVRVLSLFEVPVIIPKGDELMATFLVASSPTEAYRVEAEENRAPPPPDCVNYYFNYSKDFKGSGVTLFWQHPTNPQRDIKYFQVFRRKSVNDPFELICMLDFDDSIIRSLPREEIDPSLVKAYPGPVHTFVDPEFTKESDFIYAVTSVDARMLSSPYSPQARLTFDKHENKIVIKHFAYIGAPKQYPNWTVDERFFVDSMKDSGHEKVKIYFDPEAYTLIDGNGNRTPLFFGTGDDSFAKYVFQFINTDRLAEQRFEVVIDNLEYKNSQADQSAQEGADQRGPAAQTAAERMSRAMLEQQGIK